MRYTKQYHECLVALWKWHKSFRGQGVRNTDKGVSFSPPISRRPLPSDPSPGGGQLIPVLLQRDGGSDGNGGTGTAPSWTYTVRLKSNLQIVAYQLGVYSQRIGLTSVRPAITGTAILVSSASDVGLGNAGVSPSQNVGTGSSVASPNLYRIWTTDEQINFCPDDSSGEGS